MSSVKIPIQVDVDPGAAEKALAQLTSDMNKMGASIAQANKQTFNPVGKTAMADLLKMQAQFESLVKISGDFRKRLKETGQQGMDFFSLDFAKLYSDPSSRARQMRKAFDYVTNGVAGGFSAPAAPAPAPGGGGSGGGNGRSGGGSGGGGNNGGGNAGGGNTPASTWGSAGRKILGSGLRSLGGAGSAAAGAMEGMAGGIAGPMILANLVAHGVSAVVGAVKEKIGAAQQLDIGYDTLKRQTGDVGVGFERLKVSLQDASWSFSATYEETLKVADAFAHAAGTFGKATEHLAGEAAIAGGFARSFGIDPARSAQFFGTMRANGVTSDENGSKKLALMVGEAVAKSGSSAKMDDVLEAIASFTQQQTRFGMASANTAGWLGEFTGLTASHTPGTDPQAVAALLSSVNSAIQHGGNAGEAGQNFMYRALGSRNGLDPIQTQILQEQGLAGTMGGTFGVGSEWETFSRKYHVRSPSLGASSGQMNFTSIMDSLKANYASNPELMLSAMSRMFGISVNQAMKLADVDPVRVNGTASRLSRLKLDLSKVNATGIERLTSIEANGSLSSDEKDRQFKDVYDKNQEKTPGTEVRDAVSGVQKAITDMADKLVPLTTSILNGITYMAGGNGKMSQRQIEQAVNKAERDDSVGQINAKADAARKAARAAKQEFQAKGADLYQKTTDMRLSPAERAAAQKEYDRLKSAADTSGIDAEQKSATELADQRLAARNGTPGTQGGLRNASWLRAAAAETDRLDKLPAGTTMAQFERESQFDPAALSAKGAMGLAQVMPDTLAALEKQLGRKLNPYDPKDAVIIQRELMRQNMAKFGNVSDALKAYNGGWDKSKWGNAETSAYAPGVIGRASEFASAPMPSGAGGKGGAADGDNRKQWFAFEHNIQLTMPNGQPAGSLRTVSTAGPSGNPYGTN
ncbi:MAG: lytic transglycosylase domain-containing protein [Paraburkholderia sp.]|uniref:lytic transglycosylase domain-containing protein n=1 Tax=Paraburkholderia sp. TaxID=1926495 RepID=UPI001225B697|nr:lytic transglycosylase domain-containing protein [Paraburkholderia sp.]TAM06379.1 MAG: lytic transglycosylase domain-containing protein [Paraburkholderia sp.]